MPKISVIVPVYNVEPYLKRSMDSLMNQTMNDLEFICIDDCSTDNSLAILREYAQKDSRFKIITSEKNGGPSAARNKGLEAAKGEYLSFVDPDDAVDLNFYEELYKKAKEEDYDLVKCQRITCDNNKAIPSKRNDLIKRDRTYFTNEWQTAIYKRSITTENHITFNESLRVGEDSLFLWRILLCDKTLAIIDNVHYYYCKRSDSLNAKKLPLANAKSALESYMLILNHVNESDVYSKDKDHYIMFFYRILNSMIDYLYRCDDKILQHYIAQALIKSFHECKDTKTLEEKFKYKFILKYIKRKDVDGLTKLFNKYNNHHDFSMHNTFSEQIFSIKNENKKHKRITIFGIKIKRKKAARENK